MEPERWRQIDELLEQALEISPEDRPRLSRRGVQQTTRPCARTWKSC